MKRVVFLCTGNSCRSQIAEAYARELGSDILEVRSAGIEAKPINPGTVKTMQEAGIDISKQQSTKVTPEMLSWADAVISLSSYADEHCPTSSKKVEKQYWSVEDPTQAVGEEKQVLAEFRKAREDIRSRVEKLVATLKSQETASVSEEKASSTYGELAQKNLLEKSGVASSDSGVSTTETSISYSKPLDSSTETVSAVLTGVGVENPQAATVALQQTTTLEEQTDGSGLEPSSLAS